MIRDVELDELLKRSVDNSSNLGKIINMLLTKLLNNKVSLTSEEIQDILTTTFVNEQIISDRIDLYVARLTEDR